MASGACFLLSPTCSKDRKGDEHVGKAVRPTCNKQYSIVAQGCEAAVFTVMGKWRHAASHRPITLGGPPGAIMGFGGVARNVVAGVWVWASGGGGTWKAAEVQRASPGGALSARAAVEGPSQLVRADSRGRLMRWCARAN